MPRPRPASNGTPRIRLDRRSPSRSEGFRRWPAAPGRACRSARGRPGPASEGADRQPYSRSL
ncbi:hypothetical protein DKM19_41820 [Streptosporangium sp. 'caverna']|nr:hypothetical protein DKM19_41820 [Streptosporangium sp. 'caverna']